MKNLFKEKADRGEKTIGLFVNIGDATSAEILALTKMDFAIFDTEHSPWDAETALGMIRAFELHNKTSFVRVKDIDRSSIAKMLDGGANGIVIPQVESVEQVKEIVRYGKYNPIGERGFSFVRQASYGNADYFPKDIATYMEMCNETQLLLPQCETVGALEHIEEIVAVDGIDGIFIGPFDLSISMGIPGGFDKPEFKAAIERIKTACDKVGKLCLIFCANTVVGKQRYDEGFKHCAVSCDFVYYTKAINAAVEELMGD